MPFFTPRPLRTLASYHHEQALANLAYIYPDVPLSIVTSPSTIYVVSGQSVVHKKSFPRAVGGCHVAIWRLYRWTCKEVQRIAEGRQVEGEVLPGIGVKPQREGAPGPADAAPAAPAAGGERDGAAAVEHGRAE